MHTQDEKPIIEVKNFTAIMGGDIIIDNINFNVNPGEIFVILGGSGCGKSTLLKHMIGLIEPESGEILIEGQNIGRSTEEERKTIQNKIGVMYQQGALFGSMNSHILNQKRFI